MKAMDSSGSIPEEELQGAVDMWRAANPKIVKLWRSMEQGAKKAILENRPKNRPVRVPAAQKILFYMPGDALFMVLPSGRRLCYWEAKVMTMEDGRDHITYAGVNQETKQWTRTETWGGKLSENLTQSVARDCLAVALLRVAAMGYQIVMHIHDEIIVDVPNEDKDAYQKISGAMGIPPDWAPGLPLRGDGYSTPFYKKD